MYIVKPEVAKKINNSSMTATNFNSDDGNTTYSTGCNYRIGSYTINKVYVSGNCEIALCSDSYQVIKIKASQTDGAILNFYYKEDLENNCYICTWYGKSSYKNSSYDMQFQTKLFENGAIEILCNGTISNSNATLIVSEDSNKTITFSFKDNVSYLFRPSVDNGIKYTMEQGCMEFLHCKVLLKDGENFKAFNEETNQYEPVGTELTQDLIETYGNPGIYARNGIESTSPEVYVFTKEDVELNLKNSSVIDGWYKIELKDEYDVSYTGIEKITASATETEISSVRYAIQKDGEWCTYKNDEWSSIDIQDNDDITEKAMNQTELSQIPANAFEGISRIKFVVLVKKTNFDSVVRLHNFDIKFVNQKIERVEV